MKITDLVRTTVFLLAIFVIVLVVTAVFEPLAGPDTSIRPRPGAPYVARSQAHIAPPVRERFFHHLPR